MYVRRSFTIPLYQFQLPLYKTPQENMPHMQLIGREAPKFPSQAEL